ncbi:hypothetical protein IJ818_07105 [bacterium]|nr:hypothetical protein [bacterium]
MKYLYIKHIFTAVFILFFICNNSCYGNDNFGLLSLNTAPVTLTPEEKAEIFEEKQQKPVNVEKTSAIVEVKSNKNNSSVSINTVNSKSGTNSANNFANSVKNQTKKIQPAVYKAPSKRNSQQKTSAVKIQPMQILDFDASDNTLKNKESESFLLVPIDKEQLEKENQQAKMEELTTSLIKDSPKPLTVKSKLKSKFSTSTSAKKRGSAKSKKAVLKSFIKKMFVLIIILAISAFGYFFFKKQKRELSIKDKEKALSYEEEKRNELIQAIQEFEQTEEKHKKLGQKVYINEIETYKNLDGFKKDEVSEDIIKTMKTIEQAKKNDMPLTLKENPVQGFKKNVYAFENELGTLSDEEGMALFDDVEEDIFSTENEFLNPDYYNENSEIFNNGQSGGVDNDIFIIEDDEELENDQYKIVEDNNFSDNISEQKLKDEDNEEQAEKSSENENIRSDEPKPEKQKPEKPKLQIKEKYPLDDRRGLALLTYKNVDALIGYIDEKIIVLRRFSRAESAENLSVRIYEELDENTTQYLVRTGTYKGIIEIGQDYVKSVLDL